MGRFIVLLATSVLAQWQDTEQTTKLWKLIHGKDRHELEKLVFQYPDVLELRSSDGRGGLWWAWEYGNTDALALYLAHDLALDSDDVDDGGNAANTMCAEDCKGLEVEARALLAGVKERQQEFEDRNEALDELDDDAEEEEDDDGSAAIPTTKPKQKAPKKVVDDDDDDDLFGGGVLPDSEEL
eukprot:GEMP01089676.1.p1 GENE.GEMP01089676.1~~GEMP01089676.1.p1  ORF type:complete len:196 (+),score=64.36 GEMP01089676.1:41-589(+)